MAIAILNNQTYLPDNITTDALAVTVSHQADNLLRLIWNFESLSNPFDTIVDSNDLVQLEYTAVVLESTISNNPLEMIVTLMFNDSSIAKSKLNGTIVLPMLSVQESLVVSDLDISALFNNVNGTWVHV